LDLITRNKIEKCMELLPKNFLWNILRIENDKNLIGFLIYSNFESEPHPSLIKSITVNLNNLQQKHYHASITNPPILHRKETFIDKEEKNYKIFQNLTQQEEKTGLLDKSIQHKIGHKKQWEELLKQKNLRIVNHKLEQLT
jgi:DNA phosphorothioation-associated putative methyltransferase